MKNCIRRAADKPEPSRWNTTVLVLTILSLVACKPESNSGNAPGSPPSAAVSHRSQQELAAAFSASGVNVYEAKNATDLAEAMALKQANLSLADEGLVVEAVGDDPSLLLPKITTFRPSIAKVVIVAPGATLTQLFYLVNGIKTFDEAHSMSHPIQGGRNEIFFEMSNPAMTGDFRLDPGAIRGRYVLESVEFRARP